MNFALGRVEESNRLIRLRLDRAISVGNIVEIRYAVRRLAGGMLFGVTPAPEAIGEIERLLPLVADSPTATAHALQRLPPLYAMQGRFDEARAIADRADGLLREIANPFDWAGRGFWDGPMLMLARDYEEAERLFRECAALYEEIGDKGFRSSVLADLAEALMARDRYDEVEGLADESRSIAAADDFLAQAQWRAVRAKLLAARGDFEEGERLAREAVELADPSDYLTLRAEKWLRLGEVLELAGKTDEAADAVRRATGLFEQKGNVIMAERTRQQLAALGAG
jgi:tetratricopeptide (TPR) repeat protein